MDTEHLQEKGKPLPHDEQDGISPRRSLLVGAVLGALAGGLELFGQLMLGAAWGTRGLYDVCNLVSILTPLIAGICLVAGLLGSIRWARARRLFAGSLALLLTFMLVASFSTPVRRHGLQQVCERLRPVVEAVRRHEQKHGALPTSLDALVPGELASLPRPSSVLHHMRLDTRRYGSPWALAVLLPGPPLQDKSLVHLSDGNYPSTPYRGGSGRPGLDGVGRIGDWAVLTTVD